MKIIVFIAAFIIIAVAIAAAELGKYCDDIRDDDM